MKIPFFKLEHWLNEHQFAVTPPDYDLASSTGPHWTVKELLSLVDEDERAKLIETQLTYSDAAGSEHLRQAIAEMQGVSANQIQILIGASEALLIVFSVAAAPGANVILPFPVFPSSAVIPELLGLETRFYHLRRENDFALDLDEIKSLADRNTKILLVNSPHNPTGGTITNDQMQDLHDFAAGRGIQLVSDEVYHPIYHGQKTASASVLPEATVLGSFSKSFALSGIRIGWIVESDMKRMQQYTEARSYYTISNPPLAEKLAEIAVRNRATMFGRTLQVATANLQLLDEFLAKHSDKVGWVRPRGGLTAFPWLKDGNDSRSFCEEAARRGVLLAPGDCFQMPNHFRVGFGVTANGFGEALDRISQLFETSDLAASA